VCEAEGERLAAGERANGEADALRLRAQAEADAILLRAQADAQALALINEQISQNPDLIQWRYVENLADNIELMLLPSNSPFVFDFQSLTAGQTGTAPAGEAPSAAEKPALEADAAASAE